MLTATLFQHIPKTGGTSLREYLARCAPHGHFASVYTSPEDHSPQQWETILGSPKVIFGHFDFGRHKNFGTPPRYATIFREPISRVLSVLGHFARDPQSRHYELLKNCVSVRDLIWKANDEQFNSHMLRTLISHPNGLPNKIDDILLVDEAMENLRNNYVYVCLTEELDEKQIEIAKFFDWNPVAKNPRRLNVGREDTQALLKIDQNDIDAIKEFNQLDCLLYERVKKLIL